MIVFNALIGFNPKVEVDYNLHGICNSLEKTYNFDSKVLCFPFQFVKMYLQIFLYDFQVISLKFLTFFVPLSKIT